MSEELAALVAKRFIQRRDIKAIQFADGKWSPDTKVQRNLSLYAPLGFKMQHLRDHIAGERTYGHYLLDENDLCRVFVFDIDLIEMKVNTSTGEITQSGTWVEIPEINTLSPDATDNEVDQGFLVHSEISPRHLWHDRKQPGPRAWYKYQMRMLAQKFARVITEDLGIDCAVSYSGSKGIHVYGLTGPIAAREAREGAALVLDLLDEFEPSRGNNFFRHKNADPVQGFQNFEIEVFPKQDSLENKDLGNLVRLPFGRNQKSPDPCFLLDLRTPMSQLTPHPEPERLLESGNPYL